MIATFKKSINVEDDGYVEFLFNRIQTAQGIRYHIYVASKWKEFFHFTMAEKNNTWKIINPQQLPGWIIQVEDQLSKEIIAHL